MSAAHTRPEPLTAGAVLGVARQLLDEGGLEAVSLRRIATRLGVTAPAIYTYFPDKDALLGAMADVAFRELSVRLSAAGTNPDIVERIRSMIREYVMFAQEHPNRFRLMFLFQPDFGVATSGRELAGATEAFQVAYDAVAEGIAAGRLRGEPLESALVLWTATHGAANVAMLGLDLGPGGLDRLIDATLDATLAGLAPSTS